MSSKSTDPPIGPGRYWQLKEVVLRALELPEEERRAFLEEACGGDPEMLEEAAKLLRLEEEMRSLTGWSAAPRAEPAVPLEEGTRLGAYRVLRLIDSGGMGEVYLAERNDGAFEGQVAIKLIQARGLLVHELEERFLAERQLLAELEHPNIARLLDGGTTDDGRPYLVMEHVEGLPIDRYCRDGNLEIERRLRLFLDVCGAVRHAHARLVVHRDLKPANVLVTGDGVVKLLDFGAAKDFGGTGKTPHTRLAAPMTPRYASPELFMGGPVTVAVDVYALGVVLYELLTGVSPFGDEDEDPMSGRSKTDPPPPPSTRTRRLRGRLAGDLDHIVLRALEPTREKRYASVDELVRDLELHLDDRPLESRGGAFYRTGKLARRHWKGLTAAVGVLALVTLLAGGVLERRQLERENQRVGKVAYDLGDYLNQIFRMADPATAGERNEAFDRMLDSAAALLSREAFEESPLTRAAFLGVVGQIYRRQDRLDEAESFLSESLALYREHLPPEGELIGRACINLALAFRARGRYAEARSLLWEARDVLTLHYPGDHKLIAALLNNLAGVEKELGYADQAVEHFREALAMKLRLEASLVDVVQARRNLAAGLRDAGRLDAAEAVLDEASDELSRLETPNASAKAGVEHHLGAVLRERGDLVTARRLLESVLAVRVGLRDPAHRLLLETRIELALVDQLEGRLDAAEDALLHVAELRRGHLESGHPDIAKALAPLARVRAERGDAAGAAAAAEEALAIFRDRLPAGHWRIAEVEALLDALPSS